MEIEKVKAIKKALEYNANCKHHEKLGYIDGYKCKIVAYANILTLINELESENERLEKELKQVALCNKGLQDGINEYQADNKEMGKRNQQLKDRIAELEKELKEEKMCSFNRSTIIMLNEKELEHLKVENERLANRITCQVVLPDDKLEEIKKECLEKVELAKGELLKQFAERLKKEIVSMKWAREDTNEKLIKQGATIKAIHETLKEFMDGVVDDLPYNYTFAITKLSSEREYIEKKARTDTARKIIEEFEQKVKDLKEEYDIDFWGEAYDE